MRFEPMIKGAIMGGDVTSGSYFTFNGVKYGEYTEILFTDEFYGRVEKKYRRNCKSLIARAYAYPWFRTFRDIKDVNGKKLWSFGEDLISHRYYNIVPDRDIAKIITPIYYHTPMELAKKRWRNGTWFAYIWKETLIYLFFLLISPIFQQWYVIWTTGLGVYLWIAYKKLSEGRIY